MRRIESVILPDPSSLDGLTDHCTPARARLLRRPVLRTISSTTRIMVLSMFALIVARFAHSYGWTAAAVAGAVFILMIVVLAARVLQTAVPVRRPRRRTRRATYVLQEGTAVIEARVTSTDRAVVELSNHAKLPGTSSETVQVMRRTLIAAILRTNQRITLRVTTRVPALARRYAEDFDAAAEAIGLDRRSVTRPVRAWERVMGLRTEVRLELS